MREYELNKVASIMESHVSEGRILSLKDIKAEDVLESELEDLLSDQMWELLECGRDPYYFDMLIFANDLYFIIVDEYLFVNYCDKTFEIDGIFNETLYNRFRDIVLNTKCRTIDDII